eukprot:12237283-Ditylum_brightwellii.AAC.1
MKLTTITKMMLMLMAELPQIWWHHLLNVHLILVSKNWPILASLPVKNRPSCQCPELWGGGRIVNIS